MAAYYPAVRNLNVSLSPSGYVQCTVLDPQTGSTVSYTGPTNQSVTQLTVFDGIVAYTSGSGFSRYLHAFTYDPYVKSFRAFSLGILNQSALYLSVKDGLVAVFRSSGTFDGDFTALTYDPSYNNGSWQYYNYGITTNAVTNFVCSEGVAALSFENGFQTNGIHAVMYDHLSKDLESVNRSVSPVSALQVSDATLYYTTASSTSMIGYDAGSGWTNGIYSDLLCSFHAASADGYDKRFVWVTDMSFAAGSWLLSYGDGSSFAQRSGYHQYASVAQFGISSSLTGTNGSSTSCTDSIATGNVSVDEIAFKNFQIRREGVNLHVTGWPAGRSAVLEFIYTGGAVLATFHATGAEDFYVPVGSFHPGLMIVRVFSEGREPFSRKMVLMN